MEWNVKPLAKSLAPPKIYQNFDTERFMIHSVYWGFQQYLQTQGLCIIIQIGDVTPKGDCLPTFGKKEKEQLWEQE